MFTGKTCLIATGETCSLFSYAHCAVRDDSVQLLRGDLFSHEEGAISMFSMDQKMRAHLCFVVFHFM